jgi:transcription antitermination factor NusG
MKLDSTRRCWLATYTRSRYEHEVARQFGQKNLEHLLPTYQRVSRWSDRIKRVDTPLFPQYVFVRVHEAERVGVLRMLGVVRIVSVAGKPAVICDEELERLRACVQAGSVEPHPYLKVGRRVCVKHGPFAGWEGTLIEKQNSRRLVVTIEQIQQSMSINLHSADVEPL